MATGTTASGVSALIRTKLQPPNLAATFVPLPRLFMRLESGYQAGISLVSAPTGFGKTTVVAAWLEQRRQQGRPEPAAWISLDADDDALPRFLAYLCAAITQLYPDAMPHTRLRLAGSGFDSPRAAVISLLADLEAAPGPFILVLDDFHLIGLGAVQQLMAALLHQRLPNCHLVLISRTDPAVAMAHLRAQGRLIDLRASDLRFTLPEATELVRAHAELRLTADGINALLQQTEGWVAGLHLALLALHNEPDSNRFVQTLPSKHEFVARYLLDEVFARQPSAVQHCLLYTSILDRFCAELLEAVADCGNAPHDLALPFSSGAEFIGWLRKAGLFVVPLDHENRWHRYHHLFADFLRNRLLAQCGPAFVAELHLRASRWCAAAECIDEAVSHAIAGGDAELAAQIVEAAVSAALEQERFSAVKTWLDTLPPRIVNRRARLALARCWLYVNRWRVDELRSLLPTVATLIAQEAERAGAQDDSHVHALRGELAGLHCVSSTLANDGPAGLHYGYAALASTPATHGFAVTTVKTFMALAMQLCGDRGNAVTFLQRELLVAQAEGRGLDARLVTGLEIVAWRAGDLQHLEQLASLQQQLALDYTMLASEGWSRLFAGMVHYARNQLAQAGQALACFAANYTDNYNNGAWINGTYWLAITLQRLGDEAAATRVADFAMQIAAQRGHLRMIDTAQLLRRHLALLRNDLTTAAQGSFEWSRPDSFPWSLFAVRDLIQVMYLLAVGSTADLQAARAILDAWLQHAHSVHANNRVIEVLALRAAVGNAQGNAESALADLRSALRLAEPLGLACCFVEIGAYLAPVISALTPAEQKRPLVQQIVAASPTIPAVVPADISPSLANAALLTAREMDVLHLLGRRYSDKEIATQLYISVSTVKRHSANIYQKLYVNSRREAVAMAQSLGILPPATG